MMRNGLKAMRRKVQLAAALVFLTLVPAVLSGGMALAVEDRHSAVILLYHRFGEDQYPSTSIRLAQFDAHLDYLEENSFTVVPLSRIVEAMRSGTPLPDRSVAITVDDSFQSFADEGWPRLKARGFPATLFVSTDAVDDGYSDFTSWDTLRRLAKEGLEIGHHGAAHIDMVAAGVEEALADIDMASARFEAELGFVPDLLAYPFGAYSVPLAKAIERKGFAGAAAQYSGAVALSDDRYQIPRFALNERYGEQDRFELLIRSRALAVDHVVPEHVVLDKRSMNPPAYGFTLSEPIPGLSAMNCFASNQAERIQPKVIAERRVEVRLERAFGSGRQRITCTLPGPDGRWFWRGRFFYVPERD